MNATLTQKYQDGWRPIYFASSRLTDIESRWGQTELEARETQWEQQINLVSFLLALQHSTNLEMQRVWFPCLIRQAKKLQL